MFDMPSLSLPLALFDVGAPEFLLVVFAVLVLFGGKQLPELAKGLGKSIREFKKASAGVEQEIKRAIETAPEPPRQTTLPLREGDPTPVQREVPPSDLHSGPTP